MNARAALLVLAAPTACGGKLVTEPDNQADGRSGFDGDLPDDETSDAGPPSTPPPLPPTLRCRIRRDA